MSARPDLLRIGQRWRSRSGRMRQIVDLDTAAEVVWFEVVNGEMTERAGECSRRSFCAWAEQRVFSLRGGRDERPDS
jgi:hypothetical protein